MLFAKLFPFGDSPSSGRRKDPANISVWVRKYKWYVILVVLLLVAGSLFLDGNGKKQGRSDATGDLNTYAETLRNELKDLLSGMEGVGKCDVFVTFSDGGETVYACDEELSSSGDKSDSDRQYVLISSRSEGLVLKVYSPAVRGVAVICQGGDSTRVKNDVTEVLSRILGITPDRIAVKKMN